MTNLSVDDVARFPGEHFPVEVPVLVGEWDDEGTRVVGEALHLRCACRDDLGLDWPHP